MFTTQLLFRNLETVLDSDIFLASYPRSGNTWFRRLLADVILQVNGFHTETDLPIPFQRIIPDIYEDDINQIDNRIDIPFRIIKTHEFYSRIYKKIIYLFRDPLDTLYSYYRFHLRYPSIREKVPENPDIFCTRKIDEWCKHLESYIQAKSELTDSVLFVTYEDMHQKPIKTLNKIFSFLEIDVPSDMLEKAAQNQAFIQVRSKEELGNHSEYLCRKGKIGDSKKNLSIDTIEFLEKRTNSIYSRALLANEENSTECSKNFQEEIEQYINQKRSNKPKINIILTPKISTEIIENCAKNTNVEPYIVAYNGGQEKFQQYIDSMPRLNYINFNEIAKENTKYTWDILITTRKDAYEVGLDRLRHILCYKSVIFADSISYAQQKIIQKQLYLWGFEKEYEKPLAYHLKTKTILVINNLYPPQELGGYGRYICDFANILRNRGHIVKVLTSDAPYLGDISTTEPHVDRSLLLFGNYEKMPPKAVQSQEERNNIIKNNDKIIKQYIKTYNPDVCLVGNIDFLSDAIFQPFLENQIPTIHHVAFNQTGYSLEKTPQNDFYHLSACSEFTKNKILELGYLLDDISVIYPGAFVNKFRLPVSQNLDKLRVVFAGLVLPYKGPQVLIKALKILHDAGIDFHCSIAGATPEESFLQELLNFTQAAGMSQKVDFLGYLSRNELISLYATHNVFVFPSVWEEPFGISQVEGMAAGLLLINSGTGGASEVIEHGVSGIKFPAGNAQALANALISLLNDRDKWKHLMINGQERAMKLLNIENSIDLLEEKFEEKFQELVVQENYKETSLFKRRQISLQENLKLQSFNLIIFPDWFQNDEEKIGVEIQTIISSIVNSRKKDHSTLLIDSTGIREENANLIIAGITMNLLMEEDLNVENGPEISLIGKLNRMQWEALIPLLTARVVIENENQEAVRETSADLLPVYSIDSLNKY